MATQNDNAFVLLEKRIEKMNNLQVFDIKNFRKKMRPFFKTWTLGDSIHHIGLRMKGTKFSILAQLVDVNNEGLYNFKVRSSKHGEAILFSIWVKNDKEFIDKIFSKYDLFS